MKILLVDDQDALVELISEHFTERGFLVDAVGTLEEAREALASASYDLLVLDLALPDGDGKELLERMSAQDLDMLPTIVMSAYDSLPERLASLNGGADDFLPKPFSFDELEARVRAVLRRPRKSQPKYLSCGALAYDPVSRQVTAQGISVDASRREIALLEALLRASGRAVAREYLEQRLYSFNEPVTSNALEAVVSRLRRRLAVANADARIETRRGIGYRLVAGGNAAQGQA